MKVALQMLQIIICFQNLITMIKDIHLFMILIPILFYEILEGRAWVGELVCHSPLGGFEHNFLVKLHCLSLALNQDSEA